MRKFVCKAILEFLTVLALLGCDITNEQDPNQPSPEEFTENPTADQLNLLVTGTLSNARLFLGTYIDAVGVVGREFYRFSGSDPRFVGDLLGANGGQLDDNAFYTTNPYGARFASVKNTNLILNGAANTNSSTVTEENRQAYYAFANTMQAYELLMALNQEYENGIRIDVKDPDNLGPFVSNDEALNFIASLLDEADGELDNSGNILPFNLTSGFEGFDTPGGFQQFNRALAARVAVYREQWEEALTFVNASFLDLTGNLTTGVYHTFSGNAGDQLNPLYIAQNSTGDLRTAHPSWLNDAETGDQRLSKAVERASPFSNSGLTGKEDVFVYQNNTDPVPMIRNAELVLIYAEAKIQRNQGTDLNDAVDALNLIRNEAGLPDYSGAVTQTALIDEMLNQRRYELWFEGHRWIDMRRYDRLDQLTIDRPGDVVHTRFPRPFSEKGVQGG